MQESRNEPEILLSQNTEQFPHNVTQDIFPLSEIPETYDFRSWDEICTGEQVEVLFCNGSNYSRKSHQGLNNPDIDAP